MTSCTTCLHLDEPSDGPHCGPCAQYSGHTPVQSAQAPTHPPSAPFTDTQRLDWMLPLMSLEDDAGSVGDKRTAALASALMLGKTGREAIDFAMEGSP